MFRSIGIDGTALYACIHVYSHMYIYIYIYYNDNNNKNNKYQRNQTHHIHSRRWRGCAAVRNLCLSRTLFAARDFSGSLCSSLKMGCWRMMKIKSHEQSGVFVPQTRQYLSDHCRNILEYSQLVHNCTQWIHVLSLNIILVDIS